MKKALAPRTTPTMLFYSSFHIMRLIDPISKTKLTKNQKSNFEHTLLLQSQNNGRKLWRNQKEKKRKSDFFQKKKK
jgi:hypothetical protein